MRCVLLNRDYCSEIEGWCEAPTNVMNDAFDNLQLSAQELLSAYCKNLYNKYKTFERVSEITQLDPRTVKKHILHHSEKKIR